MSVMVAIAEALKDSLNAGSQSFTEPFAAVRRYLPFDEADLEKLSGTHVTVIPQAWSIEALTRAGQSSEYAIDIGVQKSVDATDLAECDGVMELVGEIVEFLNDRSRTVLETSTGVSAKRVSVSPEPLWIPEHLYKSNVFTAVITATYRVM